MFNVEKVHFILDEMVAHGSIVETNRINVLSVVHVLDEAID